MSIIGSMALMEMMKMRTKPPANLHKVEPLDAVNVNAMLMLMGSVAIMVMIALLFNFMMDDFNLLLLKSI